MARVVEAERMITSKLRAMAGQYGTKRDLTYAILRQAILQCELRPGQQFAVRELVEQIGVSPSPVREALSRLQGEGLVESVSSKGFQVTSLTRDLALEINTVIGALLPLTVREACRSLTPDVIAELTALCREGDSWMDRRAGGLDEDPPMLLFHRTLMGISGLPFLSRTLRGIQDMSDWVTRSVLLDRRDLAWERFGLSTEAHHAILAALLTGDTQQVERVTRDHYALALQWFIDHIPPEEPPSRAS